MTATVEFRNGAFVTEDGETKTIETENGWKGSVRQDGSLLFVCENKKASLKYQIKKNGYATLVLYENGHQPSRKKAGFVIKKGMPLEGVIGLSGGENLKTRQAFFRNVEFLVWLKENGIAHVVKANPNEKTYQIEPDKDGGFTNLLTDGEIHASNVKENGDAFSCDAEVTGATYAILFSPYQENGILFTMRNPMNLDIPERYWEKCLPGQELMEMAR